MKRQDALLKRWRALLAQRGQAPAIHNTRGEILRTFRQIDHSARDFESKIGNLPAGNVLAVQIGNHEDWPSILIACLRRGIVVLPLEQSISEQQRDAAFKICRVSGIVEKADAFRKIDNERPNWAENIPSVLKLTSGTTA